MKQTVEEAARIEREKVILELHDAYKIHKDPKHYITSSATIGQYAVPLFKAGVEWQEKQSPWINARETPSSGTPLIVRFVGRYGIRYTTAVFTDNEEFLDNNGEGVNNITHYMPIPKL